MIMVVMMMMMMVVMMMMVMMKMMIFFFRKVRVIVGHQDVPVFLGGQDLFDGVHLLRVIDGAVFRRLLLDTFFVVGFLIDLAVLGHRALMKS